ncbi:MAG: PAS domain S-box protein [Desulfobacteraceae bacterium]|nr:PAS domain S-box protein [Desulfobacteraceae bacterium]
MEKNDSFFKAIFHNTGTGMAIIEEDTTISLVNKEMENFLGYARHEMEGLMSWRELVAFEEDLKRMENYHYRRRENPEAAPKKYETRMVTKNGGIKSCLAFVDIIPDSKQSVISFLDISERKQLERELQQSEEKYRNILETIEDGYFEVTLSGRFTFFNEAMCSILGYDARELKGMGYEQYMRKDIASEVFNAFNWVYRTGNSYKAFDWEMIRKDGSVCYVESSISLIKDSKGQAIGFKGVTRDITERKKAEQEREELQAELRHSQKMEAIGTLAGGIAHDFNNILSSIIGYSELCLDETSENTLMHRNLNQVLTAGNRAKDLVKQILTLSRRDEQEFTPTPIIPLAKEALKMLRSTLPSTINLQEQIQGDRLIVYADPTQIHQVIINMATNAKHALQEQGGTIEVRIEQTNFDKTVMKKYPDLGPGNYVHIAVSDTGVGIPEQNIDKIFEPYFTTKEKGVGTGLGLSTAHGIVRAHDGHITVHSEPGKGSTFNIYIPLAEPSQATEAPYKTEFMPTGAETVLLVDDEQPIVKMLQQNLQHLGYQVTPRTSSVEALAAFRAQPDKFAVVITDMTMPNMTGDKLAAEIKKIRPNMPVILCTGFSEYLRDRNMHDLQVDGVLMKPLSRIEIAKKIRQVLDGETA